MQPVSSDNKDVLRALIGGISVAGATNIGGGLERGLIQQNDASGGKLKSVYLFTDGIPTDGVLNGQRSLSILHCITFIIYLPKCLHANLQSSFVVKHPCKC